MVNVVQGIRGMNDILPGEIGCWQVVEAKLRQLTMAYGYQEIRFPVIEKTHLFQRTIGDETDIVAKEMYSFSDRNNDNLSLRPEGTAGCIRACIEHGIIHNQTQRLWYLGPMFRHERPQKGRYRQFHQFGLEAIGFSGPDIDAEIINFCADLWRLLGIDDALELVINSLGTPRARAVYQEKLVAYFSQFSDQLDADCRRRLHSNPLRILDSKNPDMRPLIENAPTIDNALDDESIAHIEQLCALLEQLNIPYRMDAHLVRGLDYYTHTVFEWQTSLLGAQNAVCAGGRYDGLIERLGGKATPAIGFALGIERLVALLSDKTNQYRFCPHAYLVSTVSHGQTQLLAQVLRQNVDGLRLLTHCGGGSLKAQFKRADKSGADLALILGEEELVKQVVGIKWLREDKAQTTVSREALVSVLRKLIA